MWGDWGEIIKHSRWPLYDFLHDPDNAPATDNTYVRMLVEPHRDLDARVFINPAHDEELLKLALENMQTFAHLDIVENPRLYDNLSDWLGKPFPEYHVNRMPMMPEEYACSLDNELNDKTLATLKVARGSILNFGNALRSGLGLIT